MIMFADWLFHLQVDGKSTNYESPSEKVIFNAAVFSQ
jgi:hypothetical protein